MTLGLKYRIPLMLLLIACFCGLAVDIAYKAVFTGAPGRTAERESAQARGVVPEIPKPALDDFRIVWERNLFGTVARAGEDRREIDVTGLKPTRLNLVLLGTVSDDAGGGFAVIEEKDKKKQDLYRIGDTVASARVVRILRGVVVLRVGSDDEVLSMEEPREPGPEGQGQEASKASVVSVKKSDIDTALGDMSKILTEARIRPYFTAGKADGFLITRITPGSLFQQMGLENGDIIQGVNNQTLESPERLLELYKGLKDGSEITLNLKRRGNEETLKYVFKE
jgi:general secretion pathway protein C